MKSMTGFGSGTATKDGDVYKRQPPICGYALPRHVHFMAKQELFVNPISRFFCTWLGAFPLNRGAIDKVAIRHALGLLKDNKVLGIFAEGNRQKMCIRDRIHLGY